MKAAALILAALLVLSGDHVTVRLGGQPLSVPVPVLVLVLELAACAVLGWLITRAARSWRRPCRCGWRSA